MRIDSIVGSLVAAVAMVMPSAAEAADRETGVSNPSEPNLIAFIGRRISVREVKHKPERNVIRFDAEYRVRVQVLEVVFGKYAPKEMEFSSFVHTGEPAFGTDEFGLVYVSRYKGRFVQQKYLFQSVHRTSDGRWAGCGDPYAREPDVHRHEVKAEPITFSPPVTFDLRKKAEEREFPSFQAPFFRIQENKATCLMGNYPRELFRVMAEGVLKARGVLASLLVSHTLTAGDGFYLNNCSIGTNASRVVIHPRVIEAMNEPDLVAEIEAARSRNRDCYKASLQFVSIVSKALARVETG